MYMALEEPRKYRLLAGEHVQDIPGTTGPNGLPLTQKFRAGDIFESHTDLEERLNSKDQACDKKVERVYDSDPYTNSPPDPGSQWQKRADETPQQFAERVMKLALAEPSPPPPAPIPLATAATAVNFMATYEAMTVAQLKAYCESEEIDLKGARTKEEILAVLRAQS